MSVAEIDTKTYMCQLLKGVIALYPDSSNYGRSCRNRLVRAQLSEMQILRHFAYHGEENGIEPHKLFKDCRDFIEAFSRNQFTLKTDNRWHYLPQTISEYKKTTFDETHFICTSCFEMHNESSRSGKTSRCTECNKEYSKNYAQTQAKLKKATSVPEVVEPKVIESPKVEVIPEPVPEPREQDPVIQRILEVVEVKPELGQIATVEDITGGRDQVMITLGVKTVNFAKLMEFLDPIINHPEEA